MPRQPRNPHRGASLGLAALVLGIVVASGACERDVTPSAQNASSNTPDIRTVTVPVNGMICMVCAGTVKSTLQAVHGVRTADVDLAKHKVTVQYERDRVNVDQLISAINDLGYKAGVPAPATSQ